MRFFAKNPLLLKIEQIPDGAPAGRVDELVAMLASPNVRLTLEFQNLATISTVDLAQGPIGIGGILPPHLDAESATNVCRRLVHYASAHKVFAFLDHLDMPERAGMAANEGVKFGMGGALSRRVRETLEHDIAFPLRPEF